MLMILKKVLYVFLTLGINLYICSYLMSKVSARVESRRGYAASRFGSITYPYFKTIKYLSKQSSINLWDALLFLFSILLWAVIPINASILILDFNSGFVVSILFYLAVLAMHVLAARSRYKWMPDHIFREAATIASLFLPVLISLISVIMINNTMNLKELVNQQYDYWNIVYQPLGFLVVFIVAVLQVKVWGLTRKNVTLYGRKIEKEGNGLPRALSRFSKYMLLFYIIALMSIFYWGGWLDLYFIDGNLLLILKFYVMFMLVILIEKAIPEIDSYKYIVDINWKFLVPVSVFNFLLTLIFLIVRKVYGLI